MQLVLIIFSVGFLGLIIYFAFSPKSSRQLKLAALIALGLISLSLGIAIVFILLGFGESPGNIPSPFFSDSPPSPAPKRNYTELLIFSAILLFILILIIVRARRSSPDKTRPGEKSR